MAMRGQFQIRRPDYIEMSLTLSATLGEWKQLVGDLPQPQNLSPPGWQLRRLIDELVKHAQQTFEKSTGDSPAPEDDPIEGISG